MVKKLMRPHGSSISAVHRVFRESVGGWCPGPLSTHAAAVIHCPFPDDGVPDERVRNHLKNNDLGRRIITTPQQLKRWFWRCLRRLQINTAELGFFLHEPSVAYTVAYQ